MEELLVEQGVSGNHEAEFKSFKIHVTLEVRLQDGVEVQVTLQDGVEVQEVSIFVKKSRGSDLEVSLTGLTDRGNMAFLTVGLTTLLSSFWSQFSCQIESNH